MAHNWKKLFHLGVTRCLSDAATTVGTVEGSAVAGLKPFSEIPGPRQLPLIGNGREMAANSRRFWMYLHEGFEKYGEIYKLNAFGKLEPLIQDQPFCPFVERLSSFRGDFL